jgi:UDP-N-acetylglucosamine 2-epimerase (non-hydrolysing)
MRVLTILGTRPEIIRLSLVIRLLDQHADSHIVVWTGQNHDERLSSLFFRELRVRQPDASMGIRSSGFGEQVGLVLQQTESLIAEHRPQRLLILGDTNSGLAAVVGQRLGVPVYHMEAGNRCYDNRVPEEINRRIIDHSSDVLMPYTMRSMENLVREGISRDRIFVTGNPIHEVLEHYRTEIEASRVLTECDVNAGQFFLATLHRAENVDDPERLTSIFAGLALVAEEFHEPVIVSTHPRLADRMEKCGLTPQSDLIRLVKPFGLFDFVQLEKHARCVLTDSGTVQEECCIMQVPNVTLRDVTERAETVECGSNILSGARAERILQAVSLTTESKRSWEPPEEYLKNNVADTVTRIVLGYDHWAGK